MKMVMHLIYNYKNSTCIKGWEGIRVGLETVEKISLAPAGKRPWPFSLWPIAISTELP
jgi:hypothetical protein